MTNLNKGTNNVSENRVITTDKLYCVIRRCLLKWYLFLIVKLLLVVVLILIMCKMLSYLHNFPQLLGCNLMMIIVLNALNIIQGLQAEPEEIIDSYYFERNDTPLHWFRLFPGKGMRLAQQEIHHYRRHKKFQEKENKQKQHKNATDHPDK